jgi:predicted DCC family thiol-disulfide oxidoreductase YuxK
MQAAASSASGAVVIYDGDCPFCSAYVRMARLREAVGPVRLVDAREGGPEVAAARAAGYDLDAGMLLDYAGRRYHGADCVHMLALLSSRSGAMNRLAAAAFRDPRAARLLYPALRAGRNLALRLLGRPRLARE